MIAYVYCSYTGSPCGFRLGKFDSKQEGNTIRLSNEDINPTITKVLKNDFIKTSYGNIPNTNEYIVVLKDLERLSTNEVDVKKKYFNFAFAFDSAELAYDFSNKLITSMQSNEDENLRYFDSFVVVDKKDKGFGLTINKSVFDTWINGLKGDRFMQMQDFNFFNVETYTSSDQSEKLQELFGMPFYREKNTNQYSNKQKKNLNHLKTIQRILPWIWIVAVLLLVIAVIWGIVKAITAIMAIFF